jgi:hypothetical protein
MSKGIVALALLVGTGAAVYTQLPEIRRYLKVKQM